MSGELTQAILDALTDVEMPRRLPTRSADEAWRIGGIDIGVLSLRGAGARQRRGGPARGGRAETPRRRRHGRHAECVRRHVRLLRLRQADPSCGFGERPRRRFRRAGRRARRGRRDGRGRRLCRSGRLAARPRLAAIPGPSPAPRQARRRLALSDRPRRGRPRDELRPADLALDGAGSGAGGHSARGAGPQRRDRRTNSRRAGPAAPARGSARAPAEGSIAEQSPRPSSFSCPRRW